MPKPVYLIIVQDTHNEYNSLTNHIWAKYEQLDSGKFGAVGTSAFNAEACELANLLAHVSQLCQRLNLPTPGPHSASIEEHFSDLNFVQAGSLG